MTERLRLLTATLLVAVLGAGFWYSTAAAGADGANAAGGEIEAAMAAVDAWESFATTGDIGLVAGWFAVDGPQYAQLQSEVGSILPSGAYDFVLSDAVVVGPGLVRGTVTVTGGDGDSQTYLWDVELIDQDNRWKVWTVRTSP